MRRSMLLTIGIMMLSLLASAVPQTTKRQEGYLCKLTGKSVKQCCCEHRGDKLYCTLAKKTVDQCCCEPKGTPKPAKNS
jgi:hypothetical protein